MDRQALIDRVEGLDKKALRQLLVDLDWRQLEAIIEEARHRYELTDQPLMADAEYDAMIDKLRLLKPNSKQLKKVGAAGDGKTPLPFPLPSMDKIQMGDDAKLQRWLQEHPGPKVISNKLDGCSLLIVIDYTQDQWELNLYPRGDGKISRNVTFLFDLIQTFDPEGVVDYFVGLTGEDSGRIAIRGELVMSKENLKKYPDMSSARSAVNGVVLSKDSNINDKTKRRAKDVEFQAFELLWPPDYSPSAGLQHLESCGVPTVVHETCKLPTKDSWKWLMTKLSQRRSDSKFDMDGIIIADDAIHEKTDENPTYAFAFKGAAGQWATRVLSVEWRASKDGKYKPRVFYEPVTVGGIVLNRATAFNARFVIEHCIGVGSDILVQHSGDTIPYISGIVSKSNGELLPPQTPYAWRWNSNKVEIELLDPESHPRVILMRLKRFTTSIGARGWSDATLQKCVDAGYRRDVQLVTLTELQLQELPAIKVTSAKNLRRAMIAALSKATVVALMMASNKFGQGFAEKKFEMLLDSWPAALVEMPTLPVLQQLNKIVEIRGFEIATAQKLVDLMPGFLQWWETLLAAMKTVKELKPRVEQLEALARGVDDQHSSQKVQSLRGLTIVFTNYRNAAWKQIIKDSGGKLTSSVSDNTDVIVFGKPGSSSYETGKAKGKKLMTPAEFAAEHGLTV